MIDRTLIEDYLLIVEDILFHPEFRKLNAFVHHGDTSVLEHSLKVSFIVYLIGSKKRKTDVVSLTRGALLHDFFLYDWHERKAVSGRKGLHGFTHPKTALNNAEKYFSLNPIERNMIRSHMWPLTFFHFPKCREARLLCRIDKIVSLKETLGILCLDPSIWQSLYAKVRLA